MSSRRVAVLLLSIVIGHGIASGEVPSNLDAYHEAHPQPQSHSPRAPEPPRPPDSLTSVGQSPQGSRELIRGACQALGGEWHDGTVPIVEGYVDQMNREIRARAASCGSSPDPLCKDRPWVELGVATYFRAIMIWQCHLAVARDSEEFDPEQVRTARLEGCAIEKIMRRISNLADAHGARVAQGPAKLLTDRLELDTLCRGPKLRLVRVVRGGVEQVGETLEFFGGPYYVEAVYDDAPKASVQLGGIEVVDENGSVSRHRILLYRVEGHPDTFRSAAFLLLPTFSYLRPPAVEEIEP